MALRPTLEERIERLLPLREVGVVLLLPKLFVPLPLPCVLKLDEDVRFGVRPRALLGIDTTFVFALLPALV